MLIHNSVEPHQSTVQLHAFIISLLKNHGKINELYVKITLNQLGKVTTYLQHFISYFTIKTKIIKIVQKIHTL